MSFDTWGGGIFYQPRQFPADPELIWIGENVKFSAGVSFINHDVLHLMLNDKYQTGTFLPYEGCIEIGDNVVIGAKTCIMPNVRIGSNTVIGAGSIVTKDLENDIVAAGVPCKKIGEFKNLVDKRLKIRKKSPEQIWEQFWDERRQ